jgi:hypothetical protein
VCVRGSDASGRGYAGCDLFDLVCFLADVPNGEVAHWSPLEQSECLAHADHAVGAEGLGFSFSTVKSGDVADALDANGICSGDGAGRDRVRHTAGSVEQTAFLWGGCIVGSFVVCPHSVYDPGKFGADAWWYLLVADADHVDAVVSEVERDVCAWAEFVA